MDIENAGHRNAVQDFWQAPRMADKPGLKAIDLFKAVHEGRIKALWIMGTNPAVSLPESDFVAEALRRCAFVAVSDVMADTETTRLANVLLPAQGWGEKDGTVTNSERSISRQRGFAISGGEARPDWRIICDVAEAMDFDGFGYASPAEIFAEHVALTQLGNDGQRKLDLTAWSGADYDSLAPQKWGGAQPFADGHFQTPDGRARFVPTPYQPIERTGLVLNTGRIRDQWHTMTRTGLVPKLFGHRGEPHVELNAVDAKAIGIEAADIISVSNGQGTSLARALVTDAVAPGQVFQSMHWSSPFAKQALVNANAGNETDPVSGQPALKSAQVKIKRFEAAWHGFGVSLTAPVAVPDYYAMRPLNNGFAFECADRHVPEDWSQFMTSLLACETHLSTIAGPEAESFRCAVIESGILRFAFVAARTPVVASRDWLMSQLGQSATALQILAARPALDQPDKGPLVCACMQVGKLEIVRFAQNHPAATEHQLCEATGAGTGCGTCRSDIRKIMQESFKPALAAE
jgi:assimilatory nitrate reductase catalytic subunit